MGKVWLKDVARAAGVSVSAASHAVNGTGNLAQGTREHILAVAGQLGYRRDPALSAIAARRFRRGEDVFLTSCAFLQLVDANESRLRHLDEATVSRLDSAARGYGIRCEPLQVCHSAQALKRKVEQLYRQGVEMLVIVSSNRTQWLEDLDLSAFVVIGLEDVPDDFPFDRVESDWGHAVRLCYAWLKAQGCRRIGAGIHFKDAWSYQDKLRVGAFASEWMVEHPEELPPLYPLSYGSDVDASALMRWVNERDLDGIVLWPLRYAYALKELSAGRKEIPMAVFQVSDLSLHSGFPGVELGRAQLCSEMARMLYDHFTHGRRGRPDPRLLLRVRGRWIENDPRSKQR